MIFAKRKECFFVILHLCTISTKQGWFIRVFIAQKRHSYSKTQQKSRTNHPLSKAIRPANHFISDKNQVWSWGEPKVSKGRSESPLIASAEAKSPARKLTSARKPPYSNRYPSITFKVLSAPSRWLRSYPWEAYTPAPISPCRISYPARRVASTSDP